MYYQLMSVKRYTIIITAACIAVTLSTKSTDFCLKEDVTCQNSAVTDLPRYVLYDVNPPEGFNLRRDVYMRMAMFLKKLCRFGDWHLVLPPWGQLYHWKSTDVGRQDMLPWSLFFDLPSLKLYAPVMEMHEFLQEYGSTVIDNVFVLQHFQDEWESGRWEEKFEVQPCHEGDSYRLQDNGRFRGRFWGYSNITAKNVSCLSFHGHASLLRGILNRVPAQAVMFDHAEIALHDMFGDAEYWRVRRSMRFASVLVQLAANFRAEHLNSTDERDGTIRPDSWVQEKAGSGAVGGPYICVHLRRKDFLWGRSKQVPSILGAAQQLKVLLDRLHLMSLFVATDAPSAEFEELQRHLPNYKVLRYKPSQAVKQKYKDGGVAIIEQIICSHARHFIGTYESTFSFRIQEEREIMGFPPSSTFNRLCGDGKTNCSEPSIWRIEF